MNANNTDEESYAQIQARRKIRSQQEYALVASVRSLTGKDAFRDAEDLVKAMVRLLPDRALDLILENLAEGKYEPKD